MNVKDIIEKIKCMPNYLVLPPEGIPKTEDNLELPADVQDFYEVCGGVKLFQNADYNINIMPPQEFVLANPVIVGEKCENDITSYWYIVADDGNGEFLTIDLEGNRKGRCYDSFYDRHGVVGDSKIIAFSFTELLDRLLQNEGQYWYWLNEHFNLGDAYDEID
ncbi:SMI1/KNR4 family protein [Lysinibacillus sp. fls2-241-R2A-57]|uniref:SMI1/KNR4 family protein n=1 Tax=Lysinibacillus sp. fls2-241-R2A-57 TaxID=3040292 RepID=UPI002555220B|nr:SMI1/KNR4 family protein [Lysinibacillus sp. fls2-241-R2A-57]